MSSEPRQITISGYPAAYQCDSCGRVSGIPHTRPHIWTVLDDCWGEDIPLYREISDV